MELRGMIHHKNSHTIWINDQKITVHPNDEKILHKIGRIKFHVSKIDADGVTICIIQENAPVKEVFLKTHHKVYITDIDE